jgi:hypothetical protein
MEGIEKRAVRDAIVSAFTEATLTETLDFRLNVNLRAKVGPGDFNTVAYNLLRVAEMEGWEAELIEAVYQERPRNAKVREVCQKYRLAPTARVGGQSTDLAGLEKTIRETNLLLDVQVWFEGLARTQNRVGRVELDGRPVGTGFLVGPSAVLTNYHVAEPVIQGRVSPAKLAVRFGYKDTARNYFPIHWFCGSAR